MLNVPSRTIFCHDNLDVLRGINSGSVDLVYLDPPFNKKKKFTAPLGSTASGAEFSDIFRAEDVKEEWLLTIKEDHFNLHDFLDCIRRQEHRGHNYNFCYLAYMAVRLLEIHRILKDTGSMYLHCDKTMCHYLKVVLDCIFGEANFRSHVIWHYGGGGASKTRWGAKHDDILHYGKSSTETDGSEQDLEKEEVSDEVIQMPGLMPWSNESTGFPTQKPLSLLERFIAASSNEGDTVLDPFCGCATTCIAAEKLGRGWIGIDVSHEAFDQVRKRAKKEIMSDLWDSRQVTFRTEPPARTDDGADDNLLRKDVYVMSNVKTFPDSFKVGIALDHKKRVRAYQTYDPHRGYKCEYHVRTHLFRELEKHIHTVFKAHGEWLINIPLADIKREMSRFLAGKG